MKKTITISVDTEAYQRLRELDVNISELCSEAMENHVFSPEAMDSKTAELANRITALSARKKIVEEREKVGQREKEERLQAFKNLNKQKKGIWENLGSIEHWKRQLGITSAQFEELRRE